MKFIKWKSLSITSFVCLLPILFGVALWESLPDTIAIHFNINNEPDNFASKGFVIFGLPVLMFALQAFCCIINDINFHKHGESIKIERVTKWIIPVMSIVLQAVTFGFSLGWIVDIRRVVVILVGCIFIVTGNYLPKLDYVKNYDIDTQKARKINRFIGFETVIMGVLMIITIFLPPIASIVSIILLIPYSVIAIIYSIKVIRKG